jgi:hypothetical protein
MKYAYFLKVLKNKYFQVFKNLKMWICEYDEQNAEQAELKLCPKPS